jgi:ComF family protein
MVARGLGHAVKALLAPPLCGACGRPCAAREPICARCVVALAATRGGTFELAGVGAVSWAAEYRGAARQLVTGLKFGHRVQLAAIIAGATAASLGPAPVTDVVAVPAAPARRRRRGFDPAELIAAELSRALGVRRATPLRRADGPRQVGRRRAERLAAPPLIWPVGESPRRVLLVDDVLTTGATLVACAAALRRAGAVEIRAGVFARTLGAGAAEA